MEGRGRYSSTGAAQEGARPCACSRREIQARSKRGQWQRVGSSERGTQGLPPVRGSCHLVRSPRFCCKFQGNKARFGEQKQAFKSVARAGPPKCGRAASATLPLSIDGLGLGQLPLAKQARKHSWRAWGSIARYQQRHARTSVNSGGGSRRGFLRQPCGPVAPAVKAEGAFPCKQEEDATTDQRRAGAAPHLIIEEPRNRCRPQARPIRSPYTVQLK